MGAPAPGAVWLPAEGPVRGRCDTCEVFGALVLEHRPVWGTVGVIPADAPQVREGCPQCRRTGTARLGTRLLVHTDPPASLAGAMPKLSASEYSWLTCQHCSYGAPCHFWAWLVCTAPGCTRESKATYHAPGEASGG